MADNVKKGKSSKKSKKDDWDEFGDDDLGDFDGMSFDDELGKDSRSPTKPGIGKEFLSGAKGGFKSDILKKLGQKSLPEEFETYSSDLSDLTSFAGETLDNSKAKLKRPIARIAKDVKKYIPEHFTRINKLVDKVIENTDEYKYQQENEEVARNNQITGELGNIFDKNIEVQKALAASSDAQAETDRKITLTNAKKTQDILTDISASAATQTSFSMQIAKEYYKKSLELQFRSYYVQADMLRSIKEHYPIFKTQFDGILKNTGLPDFVKIKMDEKYFEIARTQMLQKINTDIFTNSAFIKNVKSNITSVVNSKVDSVTSALSGVADALSGVNDLSDLDTSKSKAGTAANLAGLMGGSSIAGWLGEKVGDKIKPHLAKSKILNVAKNSIAAYATSPQSFLANLKETLSGKKIGYEEQLAAEPKAGMMKKLKNKIGSMAAGFGEEALSVTGRTSFDKDVNKESILTTKTPAVFDQLVYRSITHIIPTYLSNILMQNTRMADKLAPSIQGSLLEYNYNSRKLEAGDKVAESYGTFLKKSSGDDKSGQAASGIVGSMNLKNVSQDEKKEITQTLTDYMAEVTATVDSKDINYKNLFEETDNEKIKAIRARMPSLDKALKIIKKQSEDKMVAERIKGSAKVVTQANSDEEIRELFKVTERIAQGLSLDLNATGLDTKNFDLSDEDCSKIGPSLIRYIFDDGQSLTVKRLPDAFKYVDGDEILMKKITLMLIVVKESSTFTNNNLGYNAMIERALANLNKRILESVKLDPDLIRSIFNTNPNIFKFDKISSDALVNVRLGSEKLSDKTTDFSDLMGKTTAISVGEDIKTLHAFQSTEAMIFDKLKDSLKTVGTGVNSLAKTAKDVAQVAKEFNAEKDPTKKAEILKRSLDRVTSSITENSKAVKALAMKSFDKLGSIVKDISTDSITAVIKQLDDNIEKLRTTVAQLESDKAALVKSEQILNAEVGKELNLPSDIKLFSGDVVEIEIKSYNLAIDKMTKLRKSLNDLLKNPPTTGSTKEKLGAFYVKVREKFTEASILFKEVIDNFHKESDAIEQQIEKSGKAAEASIVAAESAQAKAEA